ncbi:MAG: mechanosensitive ion channel family protein [Chloroflexi bacterium]|nr:mechanosensitive ion channel family protein [Chloroflexota bacterium]
MSTFFLFSQTPAPRDLLVFSGIIIASVLAAWLAKTLFDKVIHRLTARTRTYLDNAIVSAVDRPLIAAVIAIGFYSASFALPLGPAARSAVDRAFPTVLGIAGLFVALRVLQQLLKWYHLEVACKFESALGRQLVSFVEAALPVVAGLLAIVLLLDLFGINIAPVKGWLAGHGPQVGLIVLLTIITIFVLDRAIPRAVNRFVARGAAEMEEEAKKRADTLARVLVAAGQAFVLFVSFFMLLSEFDINITPVLTGVGVAGVAIGFGAQNVVRDVLAGLFIILENQYRVGDVVKVADISGLVVDINLRRTMLRDLDGIVHFVPNGEIKVTSNFTKEWSRVNLNISVAYGEDLDRVIAVLNRVGKELAEDPAWAPLILKPPQVLRVDNLGDSGIDIKILGDTRPIRQWEVMGELRRRIKKEFDKEGIEIPWPHTKVYFGNSPFAGSGEQPPSKGPTV